MKNKKKQHQIKSKFYYIFWGTATISVLIGQLYVGMGYREMSDSNNRLTDFFERMVKQ